MIGIFLIGLNIGTGINWYFTSNDAHIICSEKGQLYKYSANGMRLENTISLGGENCEIIITEVGTSLVCLDTQEGVVVYVDLQEFSMLRKEKTKAHFVSNDQNGVIFSGMENGKTHIIDSKGKKKIFGKGKYCAFRSKSGETILYDANTIMVVSAEFEPVFTLNNGTGFQIQSQPIEYEKGKISFLTENPKKQKFCILFDPNTHTVSYSFIQPLYNIGQYGGLTWTYLFASPEAWCDTGASYLDDLLDRNIFQSIESLFAE